VNRRARLTGSRVAAVGVFLAGALAAAQATAAPPERGPALGSKFADASAARPADPAGSPAAPDATAEAPQKTAADLAKAAQNPIANMISVPLQSNFNFYNIDKHGYERDTMGYVLNVQPVIPLKINDDWNLITRTVIPIINQPQLMPGMGSHAGLGDIQFTSFLSPSKSGKITWGVGPVLQFPSATDDSLGSGKWSAGPSAVVLAMDGPWVVGALAQNVWSYAGDSDRPYVNQLLVQPFINYNLPKGWYLTTSPIITANWHADSDDRWTVPVGGGVGKIVKFGKLPVNLQLSSYYNVVHPDFGPEWSVRFQVQFLFPK
jgi:hypothetical protein